MQYERSVTDVTNSGDSNTGTFSATVMATKGKDLFLEEKNPRGIPKAPFIVCSYFHSSCFADLVSGRCFAVS